MRTVMLLAIGVLFACTAAGQTFVRQISEMFESMTKPRPVYVGVKASELPAKPEVVMTLDNPAFRSYKEDRMRELERLDQDVKDFARDEVCEAAVEQMKRFAQSRNLPAPVGRRCG